MGEAKRRKARPNTSPVEITVIAADDPDGRAGLESATALLAVARRLARKGGQENPGQMTAAAFQTVCMAAEREGGAEFNDLLVGLVSVSAWLLSSIEHPGHRAQTLDKMVAQILHDAEESAKVNRLNAMGVGGRA